MSELGDYLRARRGTRSPESAGLPGGGRRRAPGLRREELAALAGVSVDYLVRLEQGRQSEPSAEVLGALSRALGLGPDQRRHLFALAGRTDHRSRPLDRGEVPAALRRIVAGVSPAPAWLLDRVGRIVGWNAAAEALLGRLEDRPNYVGLLLREGSVAWRDPALVVRDAVAFLRHSTREIRDTPEVRAMVEQLSVFPEFDRLWRSHEVAAACTRARDLDHPDAGHLEFEAHLLTAADAAFQIVVLEPRTEATAEAWNQLLTTRGHGLVLLPSLF